MIGSILKNNISLCLKELEINIKNRLKRIEKRFKNKKINIKDIINLELINSSMRRIFNNNPISQLLEHTNPLAEITHKRKINFLRKKDSKISNTNLSIREIHPSHKGKICPIETTEGKNAGLTWSLTKEAKVNKAGLIKIPLIF